MFRSAKSAMRAQLVLLLVLVLAGADGHAQAVSNRLSIAATLATDYMRYGLSQTHGGGAWRMAADYEHRHGWYAGGAVGNVEYPVEYQFPEPRDLQADLYGGYRWRGRDWSVHAALSRYVYPSATVDYDYSLASFGASFRDRYFFDAEGTEDLLGLGWPARHYELGLSLPWIHDLELGMDVGRYRYESFRQVSFTHWDIGLSRTWQRFVLDLRYYDNTLGVTSLLGEPGGAKWVLTASYAIAPRAR